MHDTAQQADVRQRQRSPVVLERVVCGILSLVQQSDFVAATDERCSDTEDDAFERLESEVESCQHSHVTFQMPQQRISS